MIQYYYCTDGSTVYGPVTADDLVNMRASGNLLDTTQVCEEGTEQWKPLSSLLTNQQSVGKHDSPEESEYAEEQASTALEAAQTDDISASSNPPLPADEVSLNSGATKKYCPNCHALTTEHTIYCLHCGINVFTGKKMTLEVPVLPENVAGNKALSFTACLKKTVGENGFG